MSTSLPSTEIERRKTFLRSRWPADKILLLADVGLAEPAKARASWADYVRQSDLDVAPWVEIRALAAAAERIVKFAPETPGIGRIKGFRRFIFMNVQRTFALARPMLAALAADGVIIMLLKGAARIAGDSSAAASRFMSDVDTLIRLADRERAWAVARKCNWHLTRKLDPLTGGTWEGQSCFAHALEFAPSPEVGQTILDLHHCSRSLCRNIGDDDRIWECASRGTFLGLEVWFPSPADQLRHTLTHALMHATDGNRPIDWMFDCAELLRDGDIDWRQLTTETLASGTHVFVASALLLLRERLGLGVPDDVLENLIAAVAPPFEAEFEFRTSAWYQDTKFPGLLGDVVAAATQRADTAARRLHGDRTVPTQSLEWTERRGGGPGQIARGMTVFPVPGGLRHGETLRLTINFTAREQTGQMSVHTPLLPLKVWEAGPLEEGQRVEKTVSIPANLLLMTRTRLVGVRWTGKVPLEHVKVRWIQGPRALSPATRLARAQAASRLS